MSVLESLPDRPLILEEAEAIKESDDIECPATFTIPGAEADEGEEEKVVGLIVVVDRTAFGLMYGESRTKEVLERDVDPGAFVASLENEVDSMGWETTYWDQFQ